MDAFPLISCIMPTANRRRFVPQAIRYFQAQDYPNREEVILDDGADSIEDLIPDDPCIRYIRQTGKRTLDRKRNEAVEACQGRFIAVSRKYPGITVGSSLRSRFWFTVELRDRAIEVAQ